MSGTRPWLAATALVLTGASVQLAPVAGETTRGEGTAPQVAVRPRDPAVLVTFQFDQGSAARGVDLLILFSDARAPLKPVPRDLGCGATTPGQRFSFLNQQFFAGRRSDLSQRAGDDGFLRHRYLRIVNCSSTSWEPSAITMLVNGKRVFSGVPMRPLAGGATTRGVACTRDSCRYWEADLQRLRSGAGR